MMLSVQFFVLFLCVVTLFGTAQARPNLPLSQLQALSAFYNSTNGPNWRIMEYEVPWNFTGDLTSHYPCEENWVGIQCTSWNETNYILYLDLEFKNLSHQLPATIAGFTTLTLLNVTRNNLTGTIPQELVQLSELEVLSMRHNKFTGPIPKHLGNMSNLRWLDMAENLLTGRLPDSVGLLQHMYLLQIFRNKLSGTLPVQLGDCVSLQLIYLYNNSFTGPLPPDLGKLRNLTTLNIGSNKLNSTIPTTLTNLSQNLQYLLLNTNEFTGSIPSKLGQLTQLVQLSIANNYITGTIPASIGNLIAMDNIQIQFNQISGSFPVEMGKCLQLSTIVTSNNLMTGTLPNFLSEFKLLTTLYTANNFISGTLPQSYANMSHLRDFFAAGNMITGALPIDLLAISKISSVDLEKNALSGNLKVQPNSSSSITNLVIAYNCITGTLPPDSTSLKTLYYLSLQENFITGTVPGSLGSLPLLSELFLDNNLFTGVIPPVIGQLRDLTQIRLQFNLLTGSIPATLGDLFRLEQLQLQHNYLSNTIPSTLSELPKLKSLFLHSNKLTGALKHVINATIQSNLANVDVSNNQLTGNIPTGPFSVGNSLSTFASSTNCLSGSIPTEICNAKSLTALALDGLAAAEICQRELLPNIASVKSYLLKNYISGSVPPCLFRMPLLQSLHISGNGIEGSIPKEIAISPSLVNLSLSHNLLTGSIPKEIQQNQWLDLDLSYNRLNGRLLNTFAQPSSNASISLEVNRLSGPVPSSILFVERINILNGNIFSCKGYFSTTDLPKHDQSRDTYQCGTNPMNRSMVLSAIVIILTILVCITPLWIFKQRCSSYIASTGVYTSSAAIIAACNDYYNAMYEPVYTTSKHRPFSIVHSAFTDPLVEFSRFLDTARLAVVVLTGWICVVLLPCYVYLSNVYGTYDYEYAWTVTPAFLSGVTPAIVIMVLFISLLLLMYACYEWIIRRTLGTGRVTFATGIRMFVSGCSPRYAALLAIVSTCNFVLMIAADILYVYIALTQVLSVVVVMQIFLAVLKLVWNDHALLFLLYVVRRWVVGRAKQPRDADESLESSASPQPRGTYCNSSELRESVDDIVEMNPIHTLMKTAELSDNSPRQNVHGSCDDDKGRSTIGTISQTGRSTLFEELWNMEDDIDVRDTVFIVYNTLLNNILIPILAVLAVSSDCLNSALIEPSAVESNYQYTSTECDLYTVPITVTSADRNLVRRECSESESIVSESYDPPFIYSYECGSAYAEKFISIYVFMFLIVGFAIPGFQLLVKCWRTRLLSSNWRNSTLFQYVDFMLWQKLKDIKSLSDNTNGNDGNSCSSQSNRNIRLIHTMKFCVRITSFISLLITFGAIFPPLAVVICCAFFSYTYFEQLVLGRVVFEAKKLKLSWYREQLEKQCSGVAEPSLQSVLFVGVYASFIFAFFVFDTMGDSIGWRDALWTPLITIAVPPFIRQQGLFVLHHCNRNDSERNRVKSAQYNRRIEMSKTSSRRSDSAGAQNNGKSKSKSDLNDDSEANTTDGALRH